MRLLILRHARSGHPPSIDDFDRPLCDMGRRTAPLVGSWLRDHGLNPALVLCSPSRRTRETLALTLRAMKPRPHIRYHRELYLAELSVLLQTIRGSPPVSPLMLVGHNPGLQELGINLLTRQKGTARARAAEFSRNFPPAGLAVLDFSRGDWQGLRSGSGNLTGFLHPKSLTAIPGEP